MSLVEISLYIFLIGTVSTLLAAIIIRASYKRYRKELMEAGGAQTRLGIIGSMSLEGKNQALTGISIGLPIMVMFIGGEGLLIGIPFQYLGSPAFTTTSTIILLMLVIVLIVFLLFLVWFFLGPGSGKARIIVRRVLRSYWSHHSEEILRLELLVLREGDKNQRRAFDLIAERGCTASLVARNIIAGSA
jgi:hypothetical protein